MNIENFYNKHKNLIEYLKNGKIAKDISWADEARQYEVNWSYERKVKELVSLLEGEALKFKGILNGITTGEIKCLNY